MSANAELVTFFVFAVPLLFTAAGVVMARNPIYAAMNLVAAFFFLAGIYLLLVAHLIAFMQILVYAGAVMVLFLFVIMLLSIHDENIEAQMPRAVQWIGAAGALGLFGLLIAAVWDVGAGNPATLTADFGTVKAVGKILYSQYLLPFEATSLLLLVAIVGSVVVAKERI